MSLKIVSFLFAKINTPQTPALSFTMICDHSRKKMKSVPHTYNSVYSLLNYIWVQFDL